MKKTETKGYFDTEMVVAGDQGYQTYRRKVINNKKNKKGPLSGDPFTAEYMKELRNVETATQLLLAEMFVENKKRILKYSKYNGLGKTVTLYREIDFIAGKNDNPEIMIEIKLKERLKSTGAVNQLNKSIEIVHLKWAELKGIGLNVFMGKVYGLSEKEPSNLILMDQLPGVINAKIHKNKISSLWVSGENLLGELIKKGLLRPEIKKTLVIKRREAANPLSIIKKNKPETCFGVMQSAFNKVLDGFQPPLERV